MYNLKNFNIVSGDLVLMQNPYDGLYGFYRKELVGVWLMANFCRFGRNFFRGEYFDGENAFVFRQEMVFDGFKVPDLRRYFDKKIPVRADRILVGKGNIIAALENSPVSAYVEILGLR